jgi:hypothetical protein
MRKLNLADVKEFTPFEKVEAGGYVCGIYAVEDVPEKEYLKISYDIVEGEKKGFYSKLKKEKDWELPMFIASYKESALPFFKGTITSVEKSNKGFKFDNDETKLVGKKIGLVLFEKERINNNGKKVVDMRVDKAHSIDAIKSGDFEVPERETVADVVETKSSSPFGSKAKVETKAEVDFFAEQTESLPFDTTDDTEFPFGN